MSTLRRAGGRVTAAWSSCRTRCSRCRSPWPRPCWRRGGQVPLRTLAVDRGGDGRRAQRGHGLQPPGRPGHRRAQPADRGPRAAAGRPLRARACGCSWRRPRPPWSLAAAMLNPLCLALSPVALRDRRSATRTRKRFTAALAPRAGLALADRTRSGAWLAVRGRFDATPVVLGLAVASWVAGFDTIYSCQDVEFDRRRGPALAAGARSALARALQVARFFHAGARPRCWLSLFALEPLHPLYLAAWARWRRASPTSTRSCGRTTCRGERGVLPRERLDQRRLLRVHARGAPSGVGRRYNPARVRSPRGEALPAAVMTGPARLPGSPSGRPCARCSTASRRATTC